MDGLFLGASDEGSPLDRTKSGRFIPTCAYPLNSSTFPTMTRNIVPLLNGCSSSKNTGSLSSLFCLLARRLATHIVLRDRDR